MNDMILSSLMGGKIIKQAPPFIALEQALGISVVSYNSDPSWNNVNSRVAKEQQFFPLTLSVDGGTAFTLPYEPLISIEGKNSIVKRSVLKYNEQFSGSTYGTVKERWSTDDYKISITGVLLGENERGTYDQAFPREDFESLKYYLLQGKEIAVTSPIFEIMGIHYIAIEDFSFPFVKGENVLAYEIKALSDVPLQLFE